MSECEGVCSECQRSIVQINTFFDFLCYDCFGLKKIVYLTDIG